MSKNTNNSLKYISLAICLGVIAYAGFTLIPQFINTANPPAFAPSGYAVTKNSEKQDTPDGTIYVTTMNKGDKDIRVTQMDKFEWECNGQAQTIGSTGICYFQREGSNADYNLIFYNKGNSTYQIYTNDKGLGEPDLGTIITNL